MTDPAPRSAAAAPAPELWYVRRGEQVKGPFKPEVVDRFIAAGQIRDTDELSRDRHTWTAAADRGPFRAPPVGPAPSPAEPVAPTPPGPRAVPPRRRAEAPVPPPRRRRGSVIRSGAGAEASVPRYKQVAGLVTVMGFIVLAGFVFLPSADPNPPDCAARPRPGVNWSNCQLERRDLSELDLSGAVLRNTKLREAKLFGVRLAQADLAFAELTDASLAFADLAAVNAVGADLRGADLAYADLSNADLSHADLRGANLGGADLTGSTLDHALWVDERVCFEGSRGGCRVPVAAPPKRQETGG